MTHQIIPSGSPLEPTIGFSRAVRAGNHIFIAGTAPIGPDGTVGVGDAAAQARHCMRIIEDALHEAGASLADVTRTRIMLTDIADWEAVAAVHGEVFSTIRPACTFVEISRFINPDWLVEIEVDAVVGGDR
jgi:enamine deaminase RidA (YjgF/YER057c/UK114 family)